MKLGRMSESVALLLALAVTAGAASAAVRTGLDRVSDFQQLFADKRIGIIANQSAIDSQGRPVAQVIRALPGATLVSLFAPEHGWWGAQGAGRKVSEQMHPLFQIPVHSLYGSATKPTPAMLDAVDVLVFDIQDIGTRFYTYIWTMALAMEAAAEQGKTFVVLDRPNPIGGTNVAGNLLEPDYASFVGLYPIPVVHGMTVGELARMFNGQGWLAGAVEADLVVVPMEGWTRNMWFDQTGLVFRRPSPNMPDLETAALYPGMALLEGTNLSEGRGTTMPFKQFGAPWIDANSLTEGLNRLRLPGVRFEPTQFTPTHSKHKGLRCFGARIRITDRTQLTSYQSAIRILEEVARQYPQLLMWRPEHFNKLCGTRDVRQVILGHGSLDALVARWDSERRRFLLVRERYLLYR